MCRTGCIKRAFGGVSRVLNGKFLSGLLAMFACFIPETLFSNELKNSLFQENNGKPDAWEMGFLTQKNVQFFKDKQTFRKVEKESGVQGNVLHVGVVPEGTVPDGQWVMQTVPANPNQSYVLSFSGRAQTLFPEKDHSINVRVCFLGDNGKWLGHKPLVCLAKYSSRWKGDRVLAVQEWKNFKEEFTTPSGTRKILVRLEFSGSGVDAWFADVRLEASENTLGQMLDRPKVPAFQTELSAVSCNGITRIPDWGLEDAQKFESSKREKIVLNGLWAFGIPDENGIFGKKQKWGFLKIPGGYPGNVYGEKQKNSSPWRWIWRTVKLDKVHSDRRYFIEIDNQTYSTSRIFWDGKAIGDLYDEWGGEVEIPANLLAEKKEHTLAILFFAKTMVEPVHIALSKGANAAYKAKKDSLVSDVYLKSKPKIAMSDDIRITPSFRKKEIYVDLQKEKYSGQYEIEIRNGKKECLLKKKTYSFKHGNKYRLTIPWNNPVLWTPDTPDLLYMTVRAYDKKGQLSDESLPVRFGFREVWLSGKEIIFNGNPLRLRPRMSFAISSPAEPFYINRGFSFLKDMGFNAFMPQGCSFKGLGSRYASAADEFGMFTIIHVPTFLAQENRLLTKEIKVHSLDPVLNEYLDSHYIRKYANNPSVIIFSGFCGMFYSQDMIRYSNMAGAWGMFPLKEKENYEKLSAKGLISSEEEKKQVGTWSLMNGIKALDSSRLTLTHSGNGQADCWGTWDYLNWLPLQEWEDYIQSWAEKGIMPIGITEHGLPYAMSFINHGVPDYDFEPWLTEYCAILLGPEVYNLERPEYLDKIKKFYDPKKKIYTSSEMRHGHYAVYFVNQEPMVAMLRSEYARRIYRSWRMFGLNAGIEPFGAADNYIDHDWLVANNGKKIPGADTVSEKNAGGFSEFFWNNPYYYQEAAYGASPVPTGKQPEHLNALGEELFHNNNEFLGFIAGKPNSPTAKEHIFRPGEKVTKSIVLLWDGFSSKEISFSVQVELDGNCIMTFSDAVRMAPGTTKVIPFSFEIPAKGKKGDIAKPLSGKIKVAFSGWKFPAKDEFSFSVVSWKRLQRKVVLFDPLKRGGALRTLISRHADSPAELKNMNPELIVVAPGAWRENLLNEFPAKVPVIVQELTPDELGKMGFRCYPVRSRRFWPDISFDVAAELLHDWRGGKSFSEKFPAPVRRNYNQRIGDVGSLAETVIETPHFGRFKPWLHGEFDLAMTALLETSIEGRPVMFNQLSFADRLDKEPAAEDIAVRLFNDFGKEPAALQPLYTLNSEKLAKQLGVENPVPVKGELPENGVILVKDIVPEQTETMKLFVEKGGTVILLPQTKEVYSLLGINNVKREIGAYFPGSIPGLNAGNYHSRQRLPFFTFNHSLFAEQACGKGKWILCGSNPADFDLKKQPWLTLTARRHFRALSQILTNCGIRFADLDTGNTQNAVSLNDLQGARTILRRTKNDKDWKNLDFVPRAEWRNFSFGKPTGSGDVQLRLEFELPEDSPILNSRNVVLDAGTFDDYDNTYLNGVSIGSVTPQNSTPEAAWKVQRLYSVPQGCLKAGKNVLAVQVWNRNAGKGWSAQVRSPFGLKAGDGNTGRLYFGTFRISDDPYLLQQW